MSSNLYNVNIVGKYDKTQKATIFEGTKYTDRITGTAKKDIIITGNGEDTIVSGKGNDVIIIDGYDTKYITINNGDGDDIIQFADDLTECNYISLTYNGEGHIS